MIRALAALVGLAFLGCGGAQKQEATERDLSQFECNSRYIEYLLVGGFVAEEAGVILQCDGPDPRITRWHTGGAEGRVEKTYRLTAEQYDSLWDRIESTGWRFLEEDCANPAAVDGDPVYQIDVRDHSNEVNLTCVGKELPYPYDRLVNELDLRVAGFGDPDNAPN